MGVFRRVRDPPPNRTVRNAAAGLAVSLARRTLPKQALSYVAVGAAGTLLDFALFGLLVRSGVWVPASVAVAFLVATSVQFLMNRHWSFGATREPPGAQALPYASVTLVTLLLTVLLVEIGTRLLHLPPLVSKALSIPPTGALSFIANRYWTFGSVLRPTHLEPDPPDAGSSAGEARRRHESSRG